MDGSEVGVSEATERWSEVTLDDGSVIKVKPNVLSAIRVDGHYDPEGNPMYAVKAGQVALIVSAPQHLRKGAKEGKIN